MKERTTTKRLVRHTLWPAMMQASFGAAATEGGIGRPITAQQAAISTPPRTARNVAKCFGSRRPVDHCGRTRAPSPAPSM